MDDCRVTPSVTWLVFEGDGQEKGIGMEGTGMDGTGMEDLQIIRDLTEDLLSRLVHPEEDVREAAAEALAVSTEDEGWRANELIRQNGIEVIADLLNDPNPHIKGAALDIIIAVAAIGEEEALVGDGVIAKLDLMLDNTDDSVILDKVEKALWLLVPEVEDVVMTKPQDEY